jgi:hypothetical protein
MKQLATRRRQSPRPRLTSSHVGSERTSRCFSLHCLMTDLVPSARLPIRSGERRCRAPAHAAKEKARRRDGGRPSLVKRCSLGARLPPATQVHSMDGLGKLKVNIRLTPQGHRRCCEPASRGRRSNERPVAAGQPWPSWRSAPLRKPGRVPAKRHSAPPRERIAPNAVLSRRRG